MEGGGGGPEHFSISIASQCPKIYLRRLGRALDWYCCKLFVFVICFHMNKFDRFSASSFLGADADQSGSLRQKENCTEISADAQACEYMSESVAFHFVL